MTQDTQTAGQTAALKSEGATETLELKDESEYEMEIEFEMPELNMADPFEDMAAEFDFTFGGLI